MKLFSNIVKGILSPLKVMESPQSKGTLPAAGAIVALCALLSAVALPLAYYLNYRNQYEISLDAGRMLLMLLAAALTWFAACAAIWGAARVFGSKVEYGDVMASWGFSYIPDFWCIVLFGILELRLLPAVSNPCFAVFFNTVFVMLLVWKAIYYFIEMRCVLKLTSAQLLISTAVIGLIFAGLMAVGFAVGLQVPFL